MSPGSPSEWPIDTPSQSGSGRWTRNGARNAPHRPAKYASLMDPSAALAAVRKAAKSMSIASLRVVRLRRRSNGDGSAANPRQRNWKYVQHYANAKSDIVEEVLTGALPQ